ncbi:MAG: hypothetical protein AAF629_20680 [Chloroflexota bacterium]
MKLRKSFIVLITVFALVAISVSVSGAQGALTGNSWWTGHTIVNVGTDSATVQVTAYDSASSNTYTYTPPVLAVGASDTWLPDAFSPALPSSFSGSAVVSSDQLLKGIVNVTNRPIGSFGTTGGEAAGQYRGVDAPAETAAFPLVKLEFPAGNVARKSTTLFIQNAGNTATTVDVDFTGTGCTPCSYTTPSIGAGQMVAVSASNAGAAAGFIGAATATSNTSGVNIAAVFMETPVLENPVKQAQAANAFTPADYDDTILIPVYKDVFGNRSTGLQVQNVGTGNVDLTVTYTGDANLGTCTNQTITDSSVTDLTPGSSVTFLGGVLFGSSNTDNMPEGCFASARVVATASSGSTGTSQIAGVINESFFPSVPAGGTQQSTTYSAFAAGNATGKVNLPVAKDAFGNKVTGVTCQNTGSAAATNVVFSYAVSSGGSGTYATSAQTIAAGASMTLVNPSGNSIWSGTALPSGTLSSVTVTADQNIVCIANEAVNFGVTSISQDKNNYEGFNLTP